MKQYMIDELRPNDYDTIKTHLEMKLDRTALSGLYRIPIPEKILSEKQRAHTDCKPHYFAVELTETQLSCELLMRASGNIRCDCIGYADTSQMLWLIDYIETIIDETGVIT